MSDRIPFRVIEIVAPSPWRTTLHTLRRLIPRAFTVRYLSVRIAFSALLMLLVFCAIGLTP